MSDPTQFIVTHATVHRLLNHEGVIGIGRDCQGNQCQLHSYSDAYKRSYMMQLFENMDSEAISGKVSALAKYSHANYLPNIVRPLFLSTRKTTKTSFELAVFYETSGIGEMTLEELISAKKSHGQKFQAEEITAFFWQIADFLFLSARGASEYLDLSPLNILCKIQGYYGYNFFISNFGRKYQGKGRIYYNPKDQHYLGTKSFEALLSAAMFTFGLVLLEMSCLLPTAQLFQAGVINQKALAKRIQGVTITNDRMISSAIKGMLVLDEAKRLKPAEIFKNDEWLKLRKVIYFQSKPDFFGFKNFEGIVEYDKKTSIGEALDQNLCMQRGTFINGVFEGKGVRQVKDCLEIGIFMDGQLIEGQLIKKNCYSDSGKFKAGKIIQGLRIYLNVANLAKDSKTLQGFIGDFQEGEPKTGRKVYSDGSEEKI